MDGKAGMAEAMLAVAEPNYARGIVTAYYMAHLHGLRNYWQNAARFLRQSLEKSEDSIVDYSVDPAFRTIQADPQFQEQIAKTVLPVIR